MLQYIALMVLLKLHLNVRILCALSIYMYLYDYNRINAWKIIFTIQDCREFCGLLEV